MTVARRVWKPLDVNGLRLYRVEVHFPMRPDWNLSYVVASTSPRGAAQLIEELHSENQWRVEPIITGHALNVFQPSAWDETEKRLTPAELPPDKTGHDQDGVVL